MYWRLQGLAGCVILGADSGAVLEAGVAFAFGPCGSWLAPPPTGDWLEPDFAGAGPAATAGDVDLGAEVAGGTVGATAGALVPCGVGTGVAGVVGDVCEFAAAGSSKKVKVPAIKTSAR